MKLFGMVTTEASKRYTPYALTSLISHTTIEPGDRLLLIDNDSTFSEPLPVPWELLRAREPRSFAANANVLLQEAETTRADLYLLNNDLVFTPQWLEPLTSEASSIVSPISNAEVQYQTPKLSCSFVMELEQYLGREAELERIAHANRARHAGYRSTLTLPFFCVKLPYAAYTKIGLFDERFGKGGAEDKDYCLRAHLAGFPVRYALQSFVLHFQGRSTWRGAESPAETAVRDKEYIEAFEKKWGTELLRLAVFNDASAAHGDPAIKADLQSGSYQQLIMRLLKPQ